jgi:hypothetical protein
MDWQWALNPRIASEALHCKGPEAAEIVEDFHGLLHGFTFAALGPM